ncbi:MAG: tripartite tricarboxylate transporter TctB family protein [Clostridiales bacterium]|nr:tripartite tricarboxylate transporter TctB family protein [Clostridiales bacterium]
MFELILNVLLFVFFGWAFFTHVLEAAVPMKVAKNPYALQPDAWPKAILILLEICLLINIIKIIRKNKGKENFTLAAFAKSVPEFFKSRLFIGIVILTVASFILEPLGFIITSFLVLLAYGWLLGARKYGQLVIASVVITFILYIVFSGMLSVNLPRGFGILRDFALALENIVQSIKNLFGGKKEAADAAETAMVVIRNARVMLG